MKDYNFFIPVRLTKLKDTSKTALRSIEDVGNHPNKMSETPKRGLVKRRANKKCGICKDEGHTRLKCPRRYWKSKFCFIVPWFNVFSAQQNSAVHICIETIYILHKHTHIMYSNNWFEFLFWFFSSEFDNRSQIRQFWFLTDNMCVCVRMPCVFMCMLYAVCVLYSRSSECVSVTDWHKQKIRAIVQVNCAM